MFGTVARTVCEYRLVTEELHPCFILFFYRNFVEQISLDQIVRFKRKCVFNIAARYVSLNAAAYNIIIMYIILCTKYYGHEKGER